MSTAITKPAPFHKGDLVESLVTDHKLKAGRRYVVNAVEFHFHSGGIREFDYYVVELDNGCRVQSPHNCLRLRESRS
jgi:hypothetical protein